MLKIGRYINSGSSLPFFRFYCVRLYQLAPFLFSLLKGYSLFCSQNIQLLSCVTAAPSIYVTLLGHTIKTHHRGPDWLIAFCYLNITVILRTLLLLVLLDNSASKCQTGG